MPEDIKAAPKVSFIKPPKEALEPELGKAVVCNTDEPSDTQKAIHSIAYLLEWASQVGNADVDGFVAYGLSKLLHQCADHVGNLYTQDDILAMGGDVRNPAAR